MSFFHQPFGYGTYEFLRNCFVSNDSMNGFNIFYEVCGHIARGHVPCLVLCLLFASQNLTLENWSGGICFIAIGEVTYRLIAHILAIQFKDILAEHFNSHQFGVVTYGGCETNGS